MILIWNLDQQKITFTKDSSTLLWKVQVEKMKLPIEKNIPQNKKVVPGLNKKGSELDQHAFNF